MSKIKYFSSTIAIVGKAWVSRLNLGWGFKKKNLDVVESTWDNKK